MDTIFKFKTQLDNLKREGNKTIAYSKGSIDLNQMIMSSMVKTVKADIVIFGLSEFPKTMNGKIKYRDVFGVSVRRRNSYCVSNKDWLKIILQELYSYKKKKNKYKSVLFTGFSLEEEKVRNVDIKFYNKNLDEEKIILALFSYYVEYPENKFPEIRKIAKDSKSEYKNTVILLRNTLIDYLVKTFPKK